MARECAIIKHNGEWCWVVNAAHRCGFTYASVKSLRVRHKLTWQEAFDRRLQSIQIQPSYSTDTFSAEPEETREICVVNDRPFLTVDIPKLFGVSVATIRQTIEYYGGLQKAVNFMLRCGYSDGDKWVVTVKSYILPESDYIEKDGVLWTLNRYLDSLTVPKSTVLFKLQQGLSLDDAMQEVMEATDGSALNSAEQKNKREGISYFVRGVEYYSIQTASKAIPCDPNQITEYKREKNCSAQEAIDRFVTLRNATTFEGVVYRSAKDWVKAKGYLEYYPTINRLHSKEGYSWEDALQEVITRLQENGTAVKKKPQAEDTIAGWCKQQNIALTTFYKFQKGSGLSFKEIKNLYLAGSALDETTGKPVGNNVYEALRRKERMSVGQLQGFTKLSKTRNKTTGILWYAVKCNCCERTIRITSEEAKQFEHSEEFCSSRIYTPRGPVVMGEKIYTVGDKSNLTVRIACNEAHISIDRLNALVAERGWSIQEALDKAYASWKASNGPWAADGIKFYRRKDLAEHFNVTPSVLGTKCSQMGWTPHQWIEYMQGKVPQPNTDFIPLSSTYPENIVAFANRFSLSCEVASELITLRGGEQEAEEYIERFPKLFNPICPHWRRGEDWECIISGDRYYTIEDIVEVTKVARRQIFIWRQEITNEVSWQDVIDKHMTSVDGTHSLSQRSSFAAVIFAYKDSQGVEYEFAFCPECRSVLLLPFTECLYGQHGELCEKYRVPNGIRLPRKVRLAIKKIDPAFVWDTLDWQ